MNVFLCGSFRSCWENPFLFSSSIYNKVYVSACFFLCVGRSLAVWLHDSSSTFSFFLRFHVLCEAKRG